jgi:anti-sigma regulatory factor (Ser/Thr protein kinase)
MSPSVTRTFPAEARSVPAARRFVRDLVLAGGHERWVGDAQLAVSEVCTNAVLHAHSPFEVTVRVAPEGVYVQVWDDDPGLPARRVSAATSTTGRGLELLGAVTSSSGSQTVGPTKVVWFCLGAVAPDVGDDGLLDRWRDRPEDAAEPAGPVLEVVLRSMPVPLWLAAREHHNTLMREFSLHEQVRHDTPGQVPVDLVAADRARSLVLAALRAAGGGRSVDLHLRVRPEQARWFEALRDVLDRAERLARSGALLAPPGPPEIVAVRHWATGQVLAQLRGAAPTAWTGPLELPSASAERWAAGGDLADSA